MRMPAVKSAETDFVVLTSNGGTQVMNKPRNSRQIQMLLNTRKEIKEGDLIEHIYVGEGYLK